MNRNDWPDDALTEPNPRLRELLDRGAPSNGIDLAPWWRQNAARLQQWESTFSQPASMRPKAIWITSFLLLGITLGVLVDRVWISATPRVVCPYNKDERLTLAQAVSIKQNDQTEVVHMKKMISAACMGCHGMRHQNETKRWKWAQANG